MAGCSEQRLERLAIHGHPGRGYLLHRPIHGRKKSGRPAGSFCVRQRRQRLAEVANRTERGVERLEAIGQAASRYSGADRITVEGNRDLRQELFLMGRDDALWHIRQVAPNVGWGAWESLGKPRDTGFSEPPRNRDLTDPLVKKNADGHLEVFAPGDGAFCNRWQEAPDGDVWRHEGWNEKPKPQPTVGVVWLEAALNVGGPLNGHLEALALGSDGNLWHAWQIDEKPNWSSWHSLGSPPSKLQPTDHLTIGINQDGRLEAFVTAQDRAVWHVWQTR